MAISNSWGLRLVSGTPVYLGRGIRRKQLGWSRIRKLGTPDDA